MGRAKRGIGCESSPFSPGNSSRKLRLRSQAKRGAACSLILKLITVISSNKPPLSLTRRELIRRGFIEGGGSSSVKL